MKNVIASLFAVTACCLCVLGLQEFGVFSSVSAQSNHQSKMDASTIQNDNDRAMAEELRRATKRSSENLMEKYTGNGVLLDLDGGYQNVALARLENDGTSVSACVTSIEEANSFFGRNLETGQRVAKTVIPERNTAKLAADHGMAESEFIFYSNLIEEARQQRAMSPNSATINIVNNDGAGEGFNDATAAFANPEGGNTGATRGAQRLNVFNFAAGIWGAFLDTSVPINVRSQMDPQTCSTGSAVLGSAGAVNITRDFTGAEFAGTWYHIALANKRAGSDLIPANPDINATFNISIDSACFQTGGRWYYGLDNSTPSQRINLLVVLLHEMGHGLGFSTFTNGSTGVFASGFPDIWTRYMLDNNTGLFWNGMTDAQRQASALSNGALRWDGPNVRLASSFLTAGRDAATGRVELFAPTTFQPGSSVSHFSTTASPNLLMEPSINSGLAIDGDLTRQLLRDIGWFRDTTSDTAADTITNVSPFGGIATVGGVRTINWTNNGSFNRNVTIELSTDGGATYPTVIASNIANAGTYAWTVPNTSTTTARIRVREYDFAAPSGTSSANFTISAAPSAAGAMISGRVLSPTGRSVSRANIMLTDGNGTVRTAVTNSFGYFFFDEVPVGATYVANVRHKRYQFQPRVVNLSADLAGLDFVATQ